MGNSPSPLGFSFLGDEPIFLFSDLTWTPQQLLSSNLFPLYCLIACVCHLVPFNWLYPLTFILKPNSFCIVG